MPKPFYFCNMKKFFSIATFALCSTATYSQVTILTEDFESGFPIGFYDTILDTNSCDASVSTFDSGWVIVEDVLDNSNHVIGASSFFDPTGTANRWLISSPIVLGAYGNSITWSARSHDASFPDGYRIFISTTGNAVADFTDTLITVATEFENWTTHTVNLSDSGYNSQTIYFAFALQSTDKYILYLDDISVEKENTSSLNENLTSQTFVYPNPTRESITIESDKSIKNIYIIDLQGNTIKANSNSSTLDLTSFASGFYILDIHFENGTSEQKRIIKY